jgi:hypothetical protein
MTGQPRQYVALGERATKGAASVGGLFPSSHIGEMGQNVLIITLALQLAFFEMSALSGVLVGAAPEPPCDDVSVRVHNLRIMVAHRFRTPQKHQHEC